MDCYWYFYKDGSKRCKYCSKGKIPSPDSKFCIDDFNIDNYPPEKVDGRGINYLYDIKLGTLTGFMGTFAELGKIALDT